MLSHDQVANLRVALEPVYDKLPGDKPWQESYCYEWSNHALPVAQLALADCEFDLQVRVYCPTRKALRKYDIPTAFHYFIVDQLDPDPLVIDGTYLQFSTDKDKVAHPHSLISPASHTPRFLDEANVNPRRWLQWRADIYGEDVFLPSEEAESRIKVLRRFKTE